MLHTQFPKNKQWYTIIEKMKTKEIFSLKKLQSLADAAILKEISDIYQREFFTFCINIYIKINGYFIFSQIYIASSG